MKKNTVFSALILIIGVLLFLLRATGMTAHIALSVVGLALLVVYTVMTKKEWKTPALEILMRLCYAIALISGVVMMNVHGVAVFAIVHKACAALFVILFVVLFALKARKAK
jgi:O-antigen/teichoic acid export membrane protein